MNGTPATCSTGIVAALVTEAAALSRHVAHPGSLTLLNDGAALWLSGMGPLAARRAAQGLADAGASALAMFGVAGALDADLRSGILFSPERIVDEHGHSYAADARWRDALLQRLAPLAWATRADGALLTVATPLLTTTAKATARERHAAIAVDMESAAVAAVAAERGLPFVALRAIVDEAGDTVPVALHDSVDAWGRPRLGRLIAALARHPSLLADLPSLYSRMRRATQALRAAAIAAGPALGRPSAIP